MSTLTINSSASLGNNAGYLQNVARAASALFAAIFAVKPQAKVSVAEKTHQVSIAQLYRLAGSYDSVMPNLAQELRAIAQRG